MHVVDAGTLDAEAQIRAVRDVLAEIEASDIPELLVWNKADVAVPAELQRLVGEHPGSVAISAATGEGIDGLLAAIADRLRTLTQIVELVIPYDRGDVLAALHREGEVIVEVHDDSGTRVRARLPASLRSRLSHFLSLPPG